MAASASRRSQRRCTDILCLLIFLAFWGGIIFLAYLSATVGDPYEVLYGADYLGNRCGVGAMKDKKYVYFPRADKDIIAQAAIASTMPWRVRFYGLCLERCPPVASPSPTPTASRTGSSRLSTFPSSSSTQGRSRAT